MSSMISSLASPFPLEVTTDKELRELCQLLWNWDICGACQDGQQPCNTTSCPWRRSARLSKFFEFYKGVTSSYVPELLPGSRPALRSHSDVFDIIRLIKKRPTVARSELTEQYFSRRSNGREAIPPVADQHRAFNLAARVMSMVTCSTENQPSVLLELGTQPASWHSSESFSDFMSAAFPQNNMGNLIVKDESGKMKDIKSIITARHLKKTSGLKFQRTDDLRHHLKLDERSGVVEIFHLTSVLKENLAASQPTTDEKSM